MPPPEIEHYLCSRCNGIFRGVGIDRCRPVKCPTCVGGAHGWPEPDDDTADHLRGVTW